jgi:hypothetical protein
MRRRFMVVTLLLALGSAACTVPAGSTPTATPSATSTVAPTATSPATPEAAAFDPASVAGIDVAAYPVLPEVSEQARAIFAASRAAGHNPRIFSKIGDCMTAAPAFLTPFGSGDYALGEYGSLQGVIDFFGGVPARGEGFTLDSFANPGLAAASGYNVASVHDPTWADPNWCRAGKVPWTASIAFRGPAWRSSCSGRTTPTIWRRPSSITTCWPGGRAKHRQRRAARPEHFPRPPGIPGEIAPVQPDHHPDCRGS